MKKVKISIISQQHDFTDGVKKQFEELGGYTFIIDVAGYDGAYEHIQRVNPLITIVDVSEHLDEAFSLVGELAKTMPQTYLVCTAVRSYQEMIINVMRIGAKDFLKFPVVAGDLESLIIRAREGSLGVRTASAQGKILTMFSTKGGTGTTSLAINLGVGLAKFSNAKVVIIDLVLQHGDVSTFLDMASTYTIADLIENFSRVDKTFLWSALTQHPSGVYVLSEPVRLEDVDVVSGHQITHVLNLLKEMFDYVIIDGGHEFNEQTLAALDMSDSIFLVTVLDIPSIQNSKRCLDIFRRLRYDENDVKLIVNRYNAQNYEGKIDLEQAERVLDYEVFWKLPNDYSGLIKAINCGEPIVTVNKRSGLSSSLCQLINVVHSNDRETPVNGLEKNTVFSKSKKILTKLIKRSLS